MREWASVHKTLVLLGVRDRQALYGWTQRLRDAQVIFEMFRETDMNEEETALAVHPNVDSDLFRNLRLL